MHATLIYPNADFLLDATHVPPLGLLQVASVLESRGLDVDLVDLSAHPDYDLASIQSELIGVTGTTPQFGELERIAKQLRGGGRRLIAGGPHAMVRPESLRAMGYEISGGRTSEIIRAFTGGSVNPAIDLEYFSPDRSLIDRNLYNGPSTVILSRGCPHACAFCSKCGDNRYHRYAARDVHREVIKLYEAGERKIIFRDDLFTAKPKWVEELCGFLKDFPGLKWECITRSDTLTEGLLDTMVDAGLYGIAAGVESGSQKILDNSNKGMLVEDNTRARKLCRDRKVRFKAYIIYGLPGESMDTMQETHRWLEENQPDTIGLYMLMPLPGSPIYDHQDMYDISIPDMPFSKMYYAGNPMEMECHVSTSHVNARQITDFYRKSLLDFGLLDEKKVLL